MHVYKYDFFGGGVSLLNFINDKGKIWRKNGHSKPLHPNPTSEKLFEPKILLLTNRIGFLDLEVSLVLDHCV